MTVLRVEFIWRVAAARLDTMCHVTPIGLGITLLSTPQLGLRNFKERYSSQSLYATKGQNDHNIEVQDGERKCELHRFSTYIEGIVSINEANKDLQDKSRRKLWLLRPGYYRCHPPILHLVLRP